jgi:hypothetical protein
MREQFGVISTTQAREAGLSHSAIGRRVASGQWQRVLPGVYRDTLLRGTPQQAALGSLLWAGADSFVCFQAAGWFWSIDGIVAKRVQLWTPRNIRSPKVTVHRGVVKLTDRRMLGLIRLTSPARTLIDLAGVLDDEDLNAAVEDAIHRGLTTAPAIARRLDVPAARDARAPPYCARSWTTVATNAPPPPASR